MSEWDWVDELVDTYRFHSKMIRELFSSCFPRDQLDAIGPMEDRELWEFYAFGE